MNSLTNIDNFAVPNTLDGLNAISDSISTNSLLVDGSNQMISNLNCGNNKIINVAIPATGTDATNKTYVDTQDNLKANITYVDTGLALKANITYVNTQDALKLNLTGGTLTGDLTVNTKLGIGTTPYYPLHVIGDSYTSGTTSMNNGNANTMTVNNSLSTSNLTITELTGTGASSNNGSLVIKHQDIGGKSSIVFPSKYNNGSDYGYIEYRDNYNTFNFENSALIIGVENDNSSTGIIDS